MFVFSTFTLTSSETGKISRDEPRPHPDSPPPVDRVEKKHVSGRKSPSVEQQSLKSYSGKVSPPKIDEMSLAACASLQIV